MIYGMNETISTIDSFSSIKYLEKVVHLALPITFVSNENAGVKEILDGWIRQYKPQLEGILVSYSNVSLLSGKNKIVGDKFSLLVDVKAKFKLFCPNVGDIVVGKINRISKEHIGCLMHETINVVIKLTEYFPDELHKFLRLERDILFEIIHFGCRRKEIIVKGKITPQCLKLMNEFFPVIDEDIDTSFSFHNQNSITRYDFDDIDDSFREYKSESLTSSNQPTDNVNNASPIPDINHTTPALQTKKSKKRKRTSSASDEKLPQLTSSNHLTDNVNNSSPIPDNPVTPALQTKKSKKCKRESSSSEEKFPQLTSSNHLTDSVKKFLPIPDNPVTPALQTKKSKKRKRESSSSEEKLPQPTSSNQLTDGVTPILDINPITPTLQTKKSKNRKKDSASSKNLSKKRKKEVKIKSKKDKKLSGNKIGIVASGEVLKNNKKPKKKHSKKSKDKRLKKKPKHKHTKKKSKHDVVSDNVEIKPEF